MKGRSSGLSDGRVSVCGLTAAASLVVTLSGSVGRAAEATYLPDATASKAVTVTSGETAAAGNPGCG